MKSLLIIKPVAAIAAVSIVSVAMAALPASAMNANPPHATSQANQQTRLGDIKSRGDAEITRRLATLNTLDGKISAATHLTAADKVSLTNEVNSEISGLTSLKSKLDSETTVSAALTDAKSIISGYRVYALVGPKVMLIKTADDQQVVEDKLTTLAGKLQTRINSAKTDGKDVSALQSSLDDLNSQLSGSKPISSSVETKVLSLEPGDYNSDHTILSGYRAQLQTARTDNQKAISDAKSIISDLKSS